MILITINYIYGKALVKGLDIKNKVGNMICRTNLLCKLN